MEHTTPIQWLTAQEVMDKIRFGRTKLYRMIKAGAFPAPIKNGTSSSWLRSAVEAWMLDMHARNEPKRGPMTTRNT